MAKGKAVGHYIANVRDIEFNLFEVFGLGEVLDAGGYGDLDADTVRTMLDEVARLAEGPVAESFADADRHPPVFDPETPHHHACPANWLSRCRPSRTPTGGGSASPRRSAGSPHPLRWHGPSMRCCCAQIRRRLFCGRSGPAMANALYVEGNEQQKQWAAKALERGWAATMVLTEPDAGSDVGAARAKAIAQPDGTWHIEGREAIHLRRRRRRHRREHLPPGAGAARGCRPRHQGPQPVLSCRTISSIPKHSNSALATAFSRPDLSTRWV